MCWVRFKATLKQELLDGNRVQPSAHRGRVGVGATVVTPAPSASCLQMYFVLLVHGSTSQRPEKIPVLSATQPCWWPYIVQRGILNVLTAKPHLVVFYEENNSLFHTRHSNIPVSEPHSVCVGPHKTVNVSLVWEAYPEVLLWPESHQADKKRIVHPETFTVYQWTNTLTLIENPCNTVSPQMLSIYIYCLAK